MAGITGDWLAALKPEFSKDYYKNLYEFVKAEYASRPIYPRSEDIFNALHLTPLGKVKVVILGQDPYHGDGQAHGLAFSVPPHVETPPSLQNIYKELQDDLSLYIPNNGYLVKWAKQGVLLLNTVLTVRAHEAFSHQAKGWERFTDAIIETVNKSSRPVVFMLWGKDAKEKKRQIDANRHRIIELSHPVARVKGIFKEHPFSLCNAYLKEQGLDEIDW